ncbi:hypothetical protein Hamer_G003194 [Homarus americanus]|uniref:Uncharacterized protein n=1 Tax=Homarus americanus TaxID=6706 RepID=A0A8J5TKS3_HOMAM|nr:hypothetical protein Hamer_G003194 [Homarus americanus]
MAELPVKHPEVYREVKIPSIQISFAKDVRSLVNMMEGLRIPFEEKSTNLVALDAKEISGAVVVKTVRNVKRTSRKQF